LEGDTDPLPCGVRIRRDIDPRNSRAAGGDRHEGGQHPDGRRFAGAVRSEEAEDLALLAPQVDTTHSLDVAAAARVALDQLFRFDRQRHDPETLSTRGDMPRAAQDSP